MKDYKRIKDIKNIIFDFGDVIINLDKGATKRELKKLGLTDFDEEMLKMMHLYEKGNISTYDFLTFFKCKIPNTNKEQLKKAWNSIILDLPTYRLDFIDKLSKKFSLYLLSNINEMHLEYIQKQIGINIYKQFLKPFRVVYYSHQINMRKPDTTPFELILESNNLKASETLFIDDTLENCETAKKLGFKVWHLDSKNEDITDLKIYI